MSDLFNILIISPESWDGHFVSKHHYAITLASLGHKVYFLNPPDLALLNIQIKETNYRNLYSVFAPLVARGLRFYPRVLRRWLESRWLNKLEKQIGDSISTVWLFENSRFYDLGFAGDRLKIYHQMDSNQNFHVSKAALTADICFVITDFILQEIKLYNDKTYKIQHGVTVCSDYISLTRMQKNNFLHSKINAVYVGNLDIPYIDINMMKSLLEKFPNISFHFIGKYDENGVFFKDCCGFSNIFWWGKVESTLIPAILAECDISLLLYKTLTQMDKKQLANSHKLMEYFASGKVTVATYTDEYKDKRSLLEMVDAAEEYIQKFEEVVNHLDVYNSEEKQQERIHFAHNHSYEKQLGKIVSYLQQNNLKGL